MRYSIITDTFPPDINGVARTLRHLAKGLVERGHQVEVVRPAPSGEGATDPSVREERVTGVPLPSYAGLRLGLPKRHLLMRKWSEKRPDAIYVATEGMLGYSAVSAAERMGIPAVSGYHTHFGRYLDHYHLPLLQPLAAAYLRRLHNRTALTLAPTRQLAAQLREIGFASTAALGRGVDGEQFHPRHRSESLRRRWGASPGSPVAIYVGRVAPEKNLPLALCALETLARPHPGFRMVVVGDGPSRRELENRFPDAVWAGAKSGDELAAHYASADLFVFPSETETYGNVVAEAMASGLVPVSYRLAAAAEIVEHRRNGFLAAPGSTPDFRHALRRALSAREAWPSMRRAARQTAESLTWGAVCNQFEDYLSAAALGASSRKPTIREHQAA